MMKKKSIVIVMVLIIAAAICIYLLTRPELLGNMNGKYTKQTTLNSTVSFTAQAGNRIKFSFRSDVKEGNLDIVLYDSKGSAVYELDKATALETFFTLDSTDTYVLAAKCNEFIGNFKIKVTKAK